MLLFYVILQFSQAVRNMTALVMYNYNQLSQYLKQALEKDSCKKWKLGNNGDHLGVHTAACIAKMAVLNQPVAALLARLDSQSAC